MEVPYIPEWRDAFIAAQTSVGAIFTAVVWHRPMRPKLASIALLAAVWVAILLPVAPDVVAAVGKFPPKGELAMLNGSAALATIAMLLSRPRWLAWVAFVGEIALAWLCTFVAESNFELAALHVVWFASLYAMHARCTRGWERPREPIATPIEPWKEDLAWFVVGVVAATLVGWFVLDHTMDSADEVGYNFDALVFARFKAFAPMPPCPEAFRSHWVFYPNDHAVAMYLPGWPYFLAPFARLGIGWFASCTCMGALLVAVVRITRRIAGAIAGRIAAIVVLLGACTLLNAGSQFPHIYMAALWAWGIESLCAATELGVSKTKQWAWGVVLGLCMGLMMSTRPNEAGLLGGGVFLVFVAEIFRRRLSWRTFVATSILFVAISALTVWVLHLQYGRWFHVGYELAADKYWWAKIRMNVPPRDAWKYGVPLMTSAFCFFPAAAALGAAGLIFAGRRVAFMIGVGVLGVLVFYVYCSYGRYRDFGYGPRYHVVMVVPMAIGMGVLLAPLFSRLRGRKWWPAAFVQEGPAILAAAAIVVGVVRIAPLVYPVAHEELHARSALHRAIERDSLTNAVVIVHDYATGGGPLIDTQNDPFDPDPSVLVLGPSEMSCTRKTFPERQFFRALGKDEVHFEPY